jgi:ABC-type transporter MlaC component
MIVRRSLGLTLGTLFILASAQGAWAATATEQLKSAIDRVLATVDNPALKGDRKVPERRVAVRKIANEILDFREVALRSLGRYWQPLSEAQRTEFVGLFGDLLERSYISKIELYGSEKIMYSGERVDGHLTTVSTKIITKKRRRGAGGLPLLHSRRQMDDLRHQHRRDQSRVELPHPVQQDHPDGRVQQPRREDEEQTNAVHRRRRPEDGREVSGQPVELTGGWLTKAQ